MTLSAELTYAILSMDAYSRGYNAAISLHNAEDTVGQNIGGNTIVAHSSDLLDASGNTNVDDDIGFYALAYDTDGDDVADVIAYRGTDYPQDIFERFLDPLNGWQLGGGFLTSRQGMMAVAFYKEIAGPGNHLTADIDLTGHSLGGGLSGFVGALYDKNAIVFDSMTYKAAAERATNYWVTAQNPEGDTVSFSVSPDNFSKFSTAFPGFTLLDWEYLNPDYVNLVYDGNTPINPDYSGITGYYIEGEVLDVMLPLRNGSEAELRPLTLGYESDLSGADLHSMASLAIRMFAAEAEVTGNNWESSAQYFWPILYDNEFAKEIGMTSDSVEGELQANEQYADILRMIIAYSSLNEGERPFGDTAIRSFYADASDLGRALLHGNAQATIADNAGAISEAFIHFSGKLALNKVLSSGVPAALQGILNYEEILGRGVLSVDVSENTWALAEVTSAAATPSLAARDLIASVIESQIDSIPMISAMYDIWGSSQLDFFNKVIFAADYGEYDLSNVAGSQNGVVFVGTNLNDYIDGTAGNDLLLGGGNGGGGNSSSIDGGAGNDILIGGAHDEGFISSSGDDRYFGGAGTDRLFLYDGDHTTDDTFTLNLETQEFSNLAGTIRGKFSGIEEFYSFDNLNIIMPDRVGDPTVRFSTTSVQVSNHQAISLNGAATIDGQYIYTNDGFRLDAPIYTTIEHTNDGDSLLQYSGQNEISFLTPDDASSHDRFYFKNESDGTLWLNFSDYEEGVRIDTSGSTQTVFEYLPDGSIISKNIDSDKGGHINHDFVFGDNNFSIVGTNHGDYITMTKNAITIVTGTGNDGVYATTGELVYTGGSDQFEVDLSRTTLRMGEGISSGDISSPEKVFLGIEIVSKYSWIYHYALEFEIAGKGKILLTSTGPFGGVVGDHLLLGDEHADMFDPYTGGTFDPAIYPDDILTPGEIPEIDFLFTPSIGVTFNDDVLEGSALFGGSGDDKLSGTGGADTLDGGAGDDLLIGFGNSDTLIGASGDDTLKAGAGNDVLSGGEGNDKLEGGTGNNRLFGGFGDDSYYISKAGINEIVDSAGINRITVTDLHSSDVKVEFRHGGFILKDMTTLVANQDGTFSGFVFAEVEDAGHIESVSFKGGRTLFLRPDSPVNVSDFDDFVDVSHLPVSVNVSLLGGDDLYLGSAYENAVEGGDGNDFIVGGQDVDRLDGGRGDDSLFGGEGNDTLVDFSGYNVLSGGGGNNSFFISGEWSNSSQITAGTGNSRVVAVDISSSDIYLYLDGAVLNVVSYLSNDVFASIHDPENVSTIAFNDQTHLFVPDFLNFGTYKFMYVSHFDDFENAQALSSGIYLQTFSGDDQVYGTEYGDIVLADDGDDYVEAGGGDDFLYGGEGNDTLNGGSGFDYLEGGAGDDVYVFQPGDDYDNIYEAGGIDTLSISGGIGFSSLSFTQIGEDLRIDIASGVIIKGQFSGNPANVVEWVSFEDGSTFEIPNPFMQTNQPPIAADDEFSLEPGSVLVGNVLADNGAGPDSDPDGDSLSVIGGTITTTSGGSVVLSSNGNFSYTPSNSFNGRDSFSYTVIDGMGGQDVGRVDIVVFTQNTIPDAKDDQFVINEDSVLQGNLIADNGFGADVDLDGANLTVESRTFQTALGGQVVITANGNFTYVALPNYFGSDSFSYTVVDDKGAADTATVSIEVRGVNDAPLTRADHVSIIEGQSASGNVLRDNGNGVDFDIEGDAISVVPAEIVTAAGGSVLLLANGDFVYSPAVDFSGVDGFEYTLTDGSGGTATGSVTINIAPLPNKDPVASDDNFTATQGILLSGNLLANNGNGVDSDADHDPLTVQSGSFITAAGGALFLSADGSFTYSPPADFVGTDSLDYTLRDGQGGTDTGTAFFTVSPPPNVNPDAQDDSFIAPQDTDIEGNLLADNGHGADTDLDGDTLAVVQEIIASVQGGSVIIMANGNFTYMPPAGFVGEDSFDYTLVDGRGGSDTATVTLTLTPVIVNHAPVAHDDSFAAKLMQSLSGNVLLNDSDLDGDQLTVQNIAVMTAAGGLVTIQANGQFVYTPMAGFIGVDSFDYTILDGRGGQDVGTVTINVSATDCTIVGTGSGETIKGTRYSDTILGLDGNDTIKGHQSADDLLGGKGNDKLYGEDGHDMLVGGQGSDLLEGGKGNDILIGSDVYVDQPQFSSANVLFPHLQETKNISNIAPPGTPALGMAEGDLSTDAPREATITFVGTGAGYNNSLGVYNVAADGTIHDVEITFGNVKNFKAGDTADITLPGGPDSDFGFFIIADGARKNNYYQNLDFDEGTLNFWFDYGQAGQRLATVNDDGDRISLVFSEGQNDTVLRGDIYHTTQRGGVTDINADEANHVVSGFVNECDPATLRIGFEDLRNLGDADYNDVVFDLSYKPVFTGAATPDGDDTLNGGDGNDLLIGGAGSDTLYGGKGADTFKYLGGNEGTDRLKDFSVKEGDKIDISDVLVDDFDPVADMISQFVKIEKQGKNSVMSVDADGGGDNYTALAIIEGGKGLNVDMMIEQGSLLL